VRDVVDEVALAVDDDDAGAALYDLVEILRDQVLEELGLAVAGAGDDVGVLKAYLSP
jgi:hypothetical protein